MKGIILDEKSIDKFKENINNKIYMVVWCYYEFYTDTTKQMLDIAKTRYGKYEWAIGVRGCSYFSLFSDQSIDDCSLEGLQKYIHSFLEVNEPKISETVPPQNPDR